MSLRGVSWASPAYASHAAESSDCDRDGRGFHRVPPGASQETVPTAAGRAGDRGAAPASDGACRRSHGFPPGFCSGLACSSCGGPRLRAVCPLCVCTGLLAGGGGPRPAPAPVCRRDSRKSCSLRGGSNARWAPSLGAQIRPSGGRGKGSPTPVRPSRRRPRALQPPRRSFCPGLPPRTCLPFSGASPFTFCPLWVELYPPPNNVLEFQLPGTCRWDLTQTEGLGRGNQVTMRTCRVMVALHPMTGGLVRGT